MYSVLNLSSYRLDKEIRDWPLHEQSTAEIPMPRPEEVNRGLMGVLMRSFATTGIRETGERTEENLLGLTCLQHSCTSIDATSSRH